MENNNMWRIIEVICNHVLYYFAIPEWLSLFGFFVYAIYQQQQEKERLRIENEEWEKEFVKLVALLFLLSIFGIFIFMYNSDYARKKKKYQKFNDKKESEK